MKQEVEKSKLVGKSSLAQAAGCPPSNCDSRTPLLCMLRCGDDVWLLCRASDALATWNQLLKLHEACGLELNGQDSGSVILDACQVGAPSRHVKGLERLPCWSLLELGP